MGKERVDAFKVQMGGKNLVFNIGSFLSTSRRGGRIFLDLDMAVRVGDWAGEDEAIGISETKSEETQEQGASEWQQNKVMALATIRVKRRGGERTE